MNQKIRTSVKPVLPLKIPQMGEYPPKVLREKSDMSSTHGIVKGITFDIDDAFMWFKSLDSSERDEPKDPHRC